ncbi:transketolase, partial [Mycobacterium tuberculosis]|nr:transketolase [Mycobacterium tuberculosis]
DAIRRAIETARTTNDRPTLIACRTIIGFGFPTKAGTERAHSDAPGEDEIAGARQTLDWHSPPFEIPDDLLKAWREIGARGRNTRLAWEERVGRAPQALRTEFERRNAGKLPDDWKQAIAAARQAFIASRSEMATRKASGEVLDRLFDAIPELLGGSADLTVSNNTKTKNQIAIEPGQFKG